MGHMGMCRGDYGRGTCVRMGVIRFIRAREYLARRIYKCVHIGVVCAMTTRVYVFTHTRKDTHVCAYVLW